MNSYLRLRHLCLVTKDLEKAVADVEAIFDVRLAYRDPSVKVFGIENAIFPFGLHFLEIAAPLSAEAAAARFLERSKGQGCYVAVFNCDNPLQRQAHVESLGMRVVERWLRDDFTLIQLHPKDTRAVLVEFDRTPGEEDLRGNYFPAGGTGWTSAIHTDLTLGMPEVVLQSPDPGGLGRHWAKLLERPYAEQDEGGHIDVDMCRISFVRCAPEQKECLRTVVVEVTDSAGVCASAANRGYAVSAGGFEFCGVRFEPRAAAA